MRRSLSRLLGLVVLLLVSPAALAEEHIRICGFNIAEFGEGDHHETRELGFIAKMLVANESDLIALQEVGVDEEAEEQVKKLRKRMNEEREAGSPKYYYFITPKSGDERCAVLYRSPVVLEDDLYWLDEDKDPANPGAGGETFFRVPVAIPFEAKDFDFVLVIVHLTWGKLERRHDEMAALREFLLDEDEEGDWIVVGDFNRYGKYNAGSENKAFDRLLEGDWKDSYRFPLLEAITEPDDMKTHQAGSDAESTTVAQSKNLYDQFIIAEGSFREFGTDSPLLGEHVGIIPFDAEEPFSLMDHNGVKYSVSDHRPIWARFRIDDGDDD